jgi:hypothetical protein
MGELAIAIPDIACRGRKNTIKLMELNGSARHTGLDILGFYEARRPDADFYKGKGARDCSAGAWFFNDSHDSGSN